MPERKTLNEDLFYRGSSANLPRLRTCENKVPFWDFSQFAVTPTNSAYLFHRLSRWSKNLKLLFGYDVELSCHISFNIFHVVNHLGNKKIKSHWSRSGQYGGGCICAILFCKKAEDQNVLSVWMKKYWVCGSKDVETVEWKAFSIQMKRYWDCKSKYVETVDKKYRIYVLKSIKSADQKMLKL